MLQVPAKPAHNPGAGHSKTRPQCKEKSSHLRHFEQSIWYSKKKVFLVEKFNWKTGSSAAGSQTSALGNTTKAAPSTATVNAPQPFANSSASVADRFFL